MHNPINDAILIQLIKSLSNEGSWCGETHIQKTTFFLQHLTNVPLEFDFTLYKYGPFSFDLSDEIEALRGDNYLSVIPQPPYGPSIVVSKASSFLLNFYSDEIERYEKDINFISKTFAKKSVRELEKLATAHYIKIKKGIDDLHEISKSITEIKPHIDFDSAYEAVIEMSNIYDNLDIQNIITDRNDQY